MKTSGAAVSVVHLCRSCSPFWAAQSSCNVLVPGSNPGWSSGTFFILLDIVIIYMLSVEFLMSCSLVRFFTFVWSMGIYWLITMLFSQTRGGCDVGALGHHISASGSSDALLHPSLNRGSRNVPVDSAGKSYWSALKQAEACSSDTIRGVIQAFDGVIDFRHNL